MFVRTSPEFVALCQSQVSLLTQGLGAAWCAVYLTEELVDNVPKLIPIVVYPDASAGYADGDRESVQGKEIAGFARAALPANRLLSTTLPQNVGEEAPFEQGYQVVLPLIYQDAVMGVLAAGRKERKWNQHELDRIEEVARTLAIAGLLDRRQVWYREQTRLQQVQGDRLDDLLHQIRNPMTALRTFAKLLLKRLFPEDRNRPIAQSLVRESDRLQELLQQLDEYADLLQGEVQTLPAHSSFLLSPASDEVEPSVPTPTPLSLLPGNTTSLQAVSAAEVLTPLLSAAEAIAQERNLNLRSRISADLPRVRVDAKALREVLSNLIDNALKYTPAGGSLEIEAGIERQTPQGRRQGIAIRNSGSGIPAEDRTHIFERRYRGVQAKGEIEGTGLGLAIAKELIEQMQGEIELIAAPEPPQHSDTGDAIAWGTTFIAWLPLANNERSVSIED